VGKPPKFSPVSRGAMPELALTCRHGRQSAKELFRVKLLWGAGAADSGRQGGTRPPCPRDSIGCPPRLPLHLHGIWWEITYRWPAMAERELSPPRWGVAISPLAEENPTHRRPVVVDLNEAEGNCPLAASLSVTLLSHGGLRGGLCAGLRGFPPRRARAGAAGEGPARGKEARARRRGGGGRHGPGPPSLGG
jgi:hypothetical protein